MKIKIVLAIVVMTTLVQMKAQDGDFNLAGISYTSNY